MGWSSLEKEIAQERIQGGAAATCPGGADGGGACCLRLPGPCFKPHRLRQIYILFIILFIAGVAGVLNCFFSRYWPYRDVIRFIDVTCETLSAEVTYHNLTCVCGEACRGTYSCLVVRTRLQTLDGHNVSTVLFATDTDLVISWQMVPKCTYHPPCGADRRDAMRHLEDFRRIISRPGTRYRCLYDPHEPRDVIQYRGVDPEQTASLLVVAGVVAALGLVGCIVVAALCGCSYVFSCSPPADIRREAEARVVEMEAMKKKKGKAAAAAAAAATMAASSGPTTVQSLMDTGRM